MSKRQIVAVFDFDGTITTIDSFNAFIKDFVGKKRWLLLMIRTFPWLVGYAFGLVSNRTIKQKFLKVFAGVTEDEFYRLSSEFADKRLNQLIRPEALQAIRKHQNSGHSLIIATASFLSWIRPWADKFGIKQCIGSEFEVVHGKLTGKILTNCYGKQKMSMVIDHLEDRNKYIIYAYGDSSADRYLLDEADYPFFRRFF